MTDEPEQPPSLSTKELILSQAPGWMPPRRESQYIEGYLRHNAEAGEGRGLTPGSYLAYHLRGKAKQYSGHYLHALMTAIQRRLQAGVIVQGQSAGGRIAYYPI